MQNVCTGWCGDIWDSGDIYCSYSAVFSSMRLLGVDGRAEIDGNFIKVYSHEVQMLLNK